MRAHRVSACVFAVAASLAACTTTGDVDYAGEVRVSSPELIPIGPEVHVIADADEPLFYSDGSYWLHRDGYWLRSDSHRGGFARVEYSIVPQPIRMIEQPRQYVHYRRHMGRDGRDIHARGGQQRTRSDGTHSPYSSPSSPYSAPGSTPGSVSGPTLHDPSAGVPSAGVPSTPPPVTHQTGAPHPATQPSGVNPTTQLPTPPVTSPNDVHGTPMPPSHGGPTVGSDPVTTAPERQLPPGHQGRVPPIHDRGNQGNRPGQGPQTPPGHDRAAQGRGRGAPDQDRDRAAPGQDRDRTAPGQDRDRTAPGQQQRPIQAGTPPAPIDDRGPQVRPDDRGPQSPQTDRGIDRRPEDRPVTPARQARDRRGNERGATPTRGTRAPATERDADEGRSPNTNRDAAPGANRDAPGARRDAGQNTPRGRSGAATAPTTDRDDQATPPNPPGDRRVDRARDTDERQENKQDNKKKNDKR